MQKIATFEVRSKYKQTFKKIAFIISLLGILIIAFFCGSLYGEKQHRHELIATKYIDGKYGEAFYGVEVTGKEKYGHVEIYAKIYISSLDSGYYHDCGNIGTGENWTDAKKQFSDIKYDGKGISIGDFRIERAEYENHR